MKVLITGITGSLGRALYPLYLRDGHEVIGYSRCELKQSQIPPDRGLTLYIGDVRNRDRLLEATRDVDLVVHTAALKRIEVCEEQPEEAIATNLTGTENVLFAQRMNRIPKVVLVSTDKSAMPTTAYGATKFLAETLVLRNPKNIVVRYGNILSSRGSVLYTFAKSIRDEKKIRVTDKRCSRFWWTLDAAAEFVLRASQRTTGGLCIPELKAYPVVKLGLMIADMLGERNVEVEEVGFRCREKIAECLRTDDEGGLMLSSDRGLWFSPAEMRHELTHAAEALV